MINNKWCLFAGLVDRFAEHRKRPLAEHLADYDRHQQDRGLSKRHRETLIPRIGRVLTECRFVFWSDISAPKVQGYVASLREGGLSIQTSNFYMQAGKQFCRWMVRPR